MIEFDENGFELPMPVTECINYGMAGVVCGGDVHTRYSRTGLTKSLRCDECQQTLDEKLNDIERRYPDSAVAPDWFDSTYAGETWDSDY
jgi:hypothetical protein